MTSDFWQVGLILVTLAVAGYALYQSHQSGEAITPTALVEHVKEAIPIAQQVQEIAQIAVNSVEQLRRERKITNNDVAFNRALDLTKKWLPKEWQVDNEDIIASINSAILVASALSKQAGRSSENVSTEGK